MFYDHFCSDVLKKPFYLSNVVECIPVNLILLFCLRLFSIIYIKNTKLSILVAFLKSVVLSHSSSQQVKEVQAVAVATDKGVPPRSSKVKMRIVITDRTGSSPPQWEGAPYPPVLISENTPIGSEVATIKARSDYFDDPRVLYDIVPGSTR